MFAEITESESECHFHPRRHVTDAAGAASRGHRPARLKAIS
jgi:hypothetical protein